MNWIATFFHSTKITHRTKRRSKRQSKPQQKKMQYKYVNLKIQFIDRKKCQYVHIFTLNTVKYSQYGINMPGNSNLLHWSCIFTSPPPSLYLPPKNDNFIWSCQFLTNINHFQRLVQKPPETLTNIQHIRPSRDQTPQKRMMIVQSTVFTEKKLRFAKDERDSHAVCSSSFLLCIASSSDNRWAPQG